MVRQSGVILARHRGGHLGAKARALFTLHEILGDRSGSHLPQTFTHRKAPAAFFFLHRFVASLPQKETHNRHRLSLVFSFGGTPVVIMAAKLNHGAFSFVNLCGLYSSLIGTKWPRVHAKPASPALHEFLSSLPRAHAGGDITELEPFSETRSPLHATISADDR